MKTLPVFLAIACGVTLGVGALGYVLLPRNYGPEAVEAVIWACGVALLGSVVGAVPLFLGGPPGASTAAPGPRSAPPSPMAGVSRFMAAMLLRLGAVGIGALAVVALGAVSVEPFLLWLAASYLVLLVVDTAFALRTFQSL